MAFLILYRIQRFLRTAGNTAPTFFSMSTTPLKFRPPIYIISRLSQNRFTLSVPLEAGSVRVLVRDSWLQLMAYVCVRGYQQTFLVLFVYI